MAEEKLVISMPSSPTTRTVRVAGQQRPLHPSATGEPTNRVVFFNKNLANDSQIGPSDKRKEMQSPVHHAARPILTQLTGQKSQPTHTSPRHPAPTAELFEKAAKQREVRLGSADTKPEQLKRVELARLRDATQKSEQLERENIALASMLKELQHQLAERDRKHRTVSISTLQDELGRMKSEYTQAVDEIQRLQERLTESDAQRDALRSYIEQEKPKMTEVQRYMESITTDNQRLNHLVDDYRQSVDRLNEQLGLREHNEKDTLKQLERYSQLLKTKEIELREAHLQQRSSMTQRSTSSMQESTIMMNAEKFLQEIQRLNEVILGKNKELVEARSRYAEPGAAAAISEAKTLRIEVKNYEELLARRNSEVLRLEQQLREKQISTQRESRLIYSRRSDANSFSAQLSEELQSLRQDSTEKQSQINRLKQQLQSANNLQLQSEREIECLKSQIQSSLVDMDQSNELTRTRIQQLEQKGSDWQRKYRQAEMQFQENSSALQRERNQLKATLQDKTDWLKSIQSQLRDSLGTIEEQRRELFDTRKFYEQRLQQMEGQRLDLQRRFNQAAYELDIRESEISRIENVGKAVAEQLQTTSNELQDKKNIIEYLESELVKSNNDFVSANDEVEELRRLNSHQVDVIQELEERLQRTNDFQRRQPTIKKVRSATTQNFLTMASENYPVTLHTMVDRSVRGSNQESSKGPEADRLPLFTLPEMSGCRSEHEAAEVQLLRRENRVIKTVMSENQQLQAKVIVFQERLKSISKDRPQAGKQAKSQINRLRDENAFLKKVTAKRQPSETQMEQQKRKIMEYEKEMADALNELMRLKGKCLQYEAKIKEYEKSSAAPPKSKFEVRQRIDDELPSENRVNYLKAHNTELEMRVYELLKLNSELTTQFENGKNSQPTKGVLEYYRQQAELAEQKVASLESKLRRVAEESRTMEKELGMYKAQADRESSRNSELNTTVHALNLQLGLLQSDRLMTQTSLATYDVAEAERRFKSHSYRTTEDHKGSNAATPRSRRSRPQ